SAPAGDEAAAARATRWIAEAGWARIASSPPGLRRDAGALGAGAAGIVLVADPSVDLHAARRGPVLVAVIDDPAVWSDCDWLDDVDLVATPDEATAAAVGARRAIVPQVIGNGTDLVAALRRWASGLRLGIAVGIPSWAVAKAWGDLHFARDLQRQLERRGIATRVHLLPDWADPVAARDDVVIHVFGLSVRQPLPGQRTILWNISHPERVTPAMLDGADQVYVASDLAAARFAAQTSTSVAPLHQATDAERFPVDRTGPAHEILFVGNTRGVRRTAVEWLVPTELDLAIYGAGWEKQPDAAPYVRGQHIPNDDVHRWYGSARILLNDHWPDMREQGFISNRLYDGLAAGAFIVTDDVPGLDAEFDDGLVAVGSGGELRWAIQDALADEPRRRATAERGRQAVLARHTFGHRIESILADLRRETGRAFEPSRGGVAGMTGAVAG
ncbi:MAG TPA: glycosyltransferase, partial [Candidatus Limnocylindrales bacterium]|nr:glycosyltransferase [Candidatus Limnocylindrales bacterium]